MEQLTPICNNIWQDSIRTRGSVALELSTSTPDFGLTWTQAQVLPRCTGKRREADGFSFRREGEVAPEPLSQLSRFWASAYSWIHDPEGRENALGSV